MDSAKSAVTAPTSPDLLVGQARVPGIIEVVPAERRGIDGQREGEVDDRALPLGQLDGPGVGGDAVGELRVLAPDPKNGPVRDDAVDAAVCAGGGHHDELALGLAEAGVPFHHRVVVVAERTQLGGPMPERKEHVRHEPGLLGDRPDPLPQISGKLVELDDGKPAHTLSHGPTLLV